MVAAPLFSPIAIPGQRTLSGAPWTGSSADGQQFPLAAQVDPSLRTLDDFVSRIEDLVSKDELKPLLHQHGGAILFRGTHASTPEDFSKIVNAFRLGPEHVELGNPVVRNVFPNTKNVSTANEGPATHPVFPHSEFGWSSHYPNYIVFFNRHPAESGGATPINNGAELLARLQAELPEFIEELATKGVRYTYQYLEKVNPGSNLGNSIARAYPLADVSPDDDKKTARAKVEREIRKHSNEWRWEHDGSLSVVHYVEGVKRHPLTQHAVYFGNITSMFLLAQRWNALEPPYIGTDGAYHHLPTYGDGSAIPHAYLQRTADLIKETRVLIDWQQGDTLILDNHYVQHAREPWIGDRRVLASLWDGPPSLPYKASA
ncbi:hypothetical protein Rhopal_007525-T1 [Rhodotorula paludigena]|uniref:TauD/TfdA-like domain-containing protein n=1 Tax=Rhodotorula paludigena TaxID=86838 RepID=A0AAV5GPD7_9BASI|nr:hypothetical protein Rhopal_007525-T1 [Rhodotorula paludigena]